MRTALRAALWPLLLLADSASVLLVLLAVVSFAAGIGAFRFGERVAALAGADQ